MDKSEYIGAQITSVRRGKGSRSCYVYAKLVAADGTLLISATLDYIIMDLTNRLTAEEMSPFYAQLNAIRSKEV